MTLLGRPLIGARVQAATPVFLFGVLVYLLFMSNQTGQEESDQAKQQLDAVEAFNLRVDGAVFPLLFEFEMSFDTLTGLQRELRVAAARLGALPQSSNSGHLVRVIEEKLRLIEDFKSRQAVLRNSRAIAAEMIHELWDQPSVHERVPAQELFAVERAFLEFVARRDPPSGRALHEAIETVGNLEGEITTHSQWPVLKAHLLKFLQYSEDMANLMQSIFVLPIPQTIAGQNDILESRFSAASVTAAQYRIALFAVAVLLLTFSALKVAQVRSYLRTIKRVNDELEHRVSERTEELRQANEGLLTEIKHREDVESQLRIAQKLESVGQLAAGVAHEINTPTQYVSDNVAFLSSAWQELMPLMDDYERSVLNGDANELRSRKIWDSLNLKFLREEVPSALEQANHGLQQISRMVLAMRNFSHPGGDALHLADVNTAIESTITMARNEWKYVAELTQKLDERLPPVPCNASAISQVILNLIVNAAHAIGAMPQPRKLGHITVSSKQLSEYVEICVEDDGPGVSAEIRDRIFDPFFTTKEVGKGTGQGLAIAYSVITKQHGGTLTVESGSGARGARFIIRLPLAISTALKRHAETQPSALAAGRAAHVRSDPGVLSIRATVLE